jgi:7-keto-8-aminopelargonate synthetase-like enzyme
VGALLSRSKVSYFKHNDVKDLRKVLEEIKQDDAAKKKKVYRKFVIIEGLYHNYGDIAPLPEILKLKEEFHFHLIMDDSLGIGTLGANGRGTCEHWGVPTNKVLTSVIPVLPHQASHLLFPTTIVWISHHRRLAEYLFILSFNYRCPSGVF